MKGTASAVLASILLLAAAGANAAKRPPERVSPNPSAIVAAEIGFNQLAQEKGQWTAFRETAAKDAVMFVPDQVLAQAWLKGRKDPPQSVKWQPHKVFVSCDGLAGVSTGAWQRPDGSTGYFTTVWRRDRKGRWKWVLDHGDALASPREPGEMIQGKVASCPRRPPAAPPGNDGAGLVVTAAPAGTGQSPDGSLKWIATVRPDKSRQLKVLLQSGTAFEEVLTDEAAASQTGGTP